MENESGYYLEKAFQEATKNLAAGAAVVDAGVAPVFERINPVLNDMVTRGFHRVFRSIGKSFRK